VVFVYTEPPRGVQIHWASLRYSIIPSLLAVFRHTEPHWSTRVHWASLRYPDTLSLIALFVYTESHYGIRLHRAFLQYSDTLNLTAVFVYTEPRYGIQTHWASLRYSCTHEHYYSIMHTEPCCGIHTYSLATVFCTLSLAVVSVHTASQRCYAHCALLWYPCIQPCNGILHAEPCCGIRAYSLATVLCTLSLTAVFVNNELHYGIQTHWLSLRYSCTLSVTTVLCTLSLAVVSVHAASQRYYAHWTLLCYPCIQPHYGIMHTEPCCSIRAYSLATIFCTLSLAVVSVHTASQRYYAHWALLWYPCIRPRNGILHTTLLYYPCIQPRNSITHTELCCGIHAYSLATVLCTLNHAIVSVHTASLLHSCSPNIRTVSVQ
jgi:hypothetical protein